MPLIVKSDGDGGGGGGGGGAGPVIPYEWVDLPAGYIEKLLNITNNEDILESNTRNTSTIGMKEMPKETWPLCGLRYYQNTFDSTVLLIKPGELRKQWQYGKRV